MCFQTFSPSERDRRSRALGRDFGKTRPRLFWTGHDPLCQQWTVDHRVDRSISQPIDGEAGVRQKSIEITRVSARSRHACRAPQSRHSHQPVRRDEDLARHKIGPPPPATGDTLRTPANTQTAAGIWQRSSRHRFLPLVHTIITLASPPPQVQPTFGVLARHRIRPPSPQQLPAPDNVPSREQHARRITVSRTQRLIVGVHVRSSLP